MLVVNLLDCWAPVLQQTSCSCPAPCLCNRVVAPVSWWGTRTFTSSLAQTTSCWTTSSMSRAAPADKQASVWASPLVGGSVCAACLVNVFVLSAGTLSSIPTALTRWTDECKVLDAESMHDCVAGGLVHRVEMVHLSLKCSFINNVNSRSINKQSITSVPGCSQW